MQYRESNPKVQFIKYLLTGIACAALIGITVLGVQKIFNHYDVSNEYLDKITKTAYYENVHYKEYVDAEGYTYFQTDTLEPQSKSMNANYEGTKEVLALDTSKVLAKYELSKSNDKLIDPLSVGMKTDIPNTYVSTLEMSQGYIGNLIADLEWVPTAIFCDTSYCDYFLSNKEDTIRIIVSKTTFKLLEDITDIPQSVDDFFIK